MALQICIGPGRRPRCRRVSSSKPSAAMRAALRGARDLYVRGLRGLERLLAAASPRRVGLGRPTSRVFGVGGPQQHSDEDLRDIVRAMQQARRRGAAASAVGSGNKVEEEDAASRRTWSSAPPVKIKRRGATPLVTIHEDAADVVHPAT